MAGRWMTTTKKPIIARLFGLIGGLCCLFALGLPAARAQENGALLTEREAVRLGLERPEARQRQEASLERAESDVVEARTWPNPTFDYARETSDEGAEDTTENFFLLSQELDLAGRRGLRTQAARQRLEAAVAENSEWRLARGAAIRRQFYQGLYLQRLQEVFSGWLARMEAIESVMRKRESAGDISGYDLRRLLRERAFAQAEQQRVRADHERTLEELRGLIGGDGTWSALAGPLLPESPPGSLESLLRRLPERPALAALKLRGEAFATQERMSARWWLPAFTLGLGAKTVDTPSGAGGGLLAGVSFPLPVFDRDAAARQRARAEHSLLRSEFNLALTRSEGELRGLWRKATVLEEGARRFALQAEETSRSLVGTAEAAYRAGEVGVLEILDAYRSAFEDEAQALSLMREARTARIELDLTTGGNTQ